MLRDLESLPPELGISRDTIGDTLSPHLDVWSEEGKEQGLCYDVAPKDTHLGTAEKRREKMQDRPLDSSSSWTILENQGPVLLKDTMKCC